MAMVKAPLITLLILLLSATASPAWYPRLAREMLLSEATTIVGHNRDYIVGPGETLMELARRSGLGYENLLRANPGIDPWHPSPGQRLLLPSATLLPEPMQAGITINLAELRLYLVWEEHGRRLVRIYPVGIGREGWETPLGEFQVSIVIEDPDWTPPASLREEKPELPGTVPPGPDNPLGSHWIGLTAQGVGIHGTNQPLGVGRRVSHGCIRLYPQDIIDLAQRVGPGTPVRILDQPVKHLERNGKLYLEVHRRTVSLANTGLPSKSWEAEPLLRTLWEARGLPVLIVPEK
jgi:L,D-transpeptidase ErfK/SrfK